MNYKIKWTAYSSAPVIEDDTPLQVGPSSRRLWLSVAIWAVVIVLFPLLWLVIKIL